MSIFNTLIKDVKTFASKIEAEFKKLFSEAPSWLTLVSGVVTYAGPIVESIVTLLNPAAGSACATILNNIKTALATAKAATLDVNGAATAEAALTALQGDLPQLLAAAKVENPTLVAEIEAAANLIIPEIDALLESFASTTSATAATNSKVPTQTAAASVATVAAGPTTI